MDEPIRWSLTPEPWTRPKTLRCPEDLEHAADTWGANCGPGALAALLSLDLKDIRLWLNAGGKWPGYTTPTKIKAVLKTQGLAATPCGADIPGQGAGLVFVQFTGPWESWPREAYKHTHWIAYACRTLREGTAPVLFAYDINGNPAGGWSSMMQWTQRLAPHLSNYPRCTGWRWRQVIEVFSE